MKTIIHAYSFYIDEDEGAEEYRALKAKLSEMGLKCFESHGGGSHYLGGLDGQTVELETAHLFNNQWNTAPIGDSKSGLRVFDWAQDYRPHGNGNLKRGHWLEQTAEMKAARNNTDACGYCGKQEPAGNYKFCPHCLDSEYLKSADLHLLRMRRVSDESARKKLSAAESAHLIPLYRAAQTSGSTARGKARIAEARARIARDYEKTVRNAKAEHDGLLWLMDHGMPVGNVIYYNHTGRFGFGRRAPVDAEALSALLDVISEFPFAYDIKCADGRTLSDG